MITIYLFCSETCWQTCIITNSTIRTQIISHHIPYLTNITCYSVWLAGTLRHMKLLSDLKQKCNNSVVEISRLHKLPLFATKTIPQYIAQPRHILCQTQNWVL
jgi:hypothetical protein